jgi:hypothetical protein
VIQDIRADEKKLAPLAQDGIPSTYYVSKRDNCWIGYDAGDGLLFDLISISLFPDIDGATTTLDRYDGFVLEGSNDDKNFELIHSYRDLIHEGWNEFIPSRSKNHKGETKSSIPMYRYIRVRDTEPQSSFCNISEIHMVAVKYSTQSTLSHDNSACSVSVNINGYEQILPRKVVYQSSRTPTVSRVLPWFGSVAGGDTLTIEGTNFGGDPTQLLVSIDGVPCKVSTATDQSISCVTSAKG